MKDANEPPVDAATNSLIYSCPTGIDPQRIEREVALQLRKTAYQTVSEDKNDPTSTALTARKGTHWIKLNAWSEGGATTYSLLAAETGTEKLKAEACNEPPVFSFEKHCGMMECTSKSEDGVQMQTTAQERTSLTGPVVTATLTCPGLRPSEIFDSAEKELKQSGFDVLFTERTHAESSSLTARAGKRWVELASAPDGETASYALTLIPLAENVTATDQRQPTETIAATEGPPVPAETTAATEVRPVPAETIAATEVRPVPAPEVADNVRVASAVASQAGSQPPPQPGAIAQEMAPPEAVPSASTRLTPPNPATPQPSTMPIRPLKPVVRTPVAIPLELSPSIKVEVIVTLLVDVNEDGSVTRATLTGRVTDNVRKLEAAALDAIARWRFEPALQGDKHVPAQTIVKLRFAPKYENY
jgi:protein TonB